MSADAAAAIAVARVTGGYKLSRQGENRRAAASDIIARDTTLYVFRTNLAYSIPGVNHLAYQVEVGDGFGVREFVYVDAHSGKVLDQIAGIYEDKVRLTYDAQDDVAGGTNSVLCRGEGDPTSGNQPCDEAHDYAGDTYDYYWNAFGRDSIDDAGMTIISYVNVCPDGPGSCPWINASWNGEFMSYGESAVGRSYTGDDTVGHELTHGVTDYTSNLIYQAQPGAINEAMSDIFGELIDFANYPLGVDDPDLPRVDYTVNNVSTYPSAPCTAPYGSNDSFSYTGSVRWLVGEQDELIRDMWAPSCYGDPDHVTHPNYWCAATDGGGVHTNSGVVNHHFALLADGGTFNGQTVTGLGWIKAGAIYYQAQTNYLVPASDFPALGVALYQACTSLVGTDLANPVDGTSSGEVITTTDCLEINAASLAVELDVSPAAQCNFVPMLNPETPAACPVGSAPTAIYDVDWESGLAGWTAGTRAVANYATFDTADWAIVTDLPDARAGSALFVEDNPAYGNCVDDTEAGVLYIESPAITIPAGIGTPILAFDHWVATEAGWDGGNVKISVNGGAWTLLPSNAFFFNPYPDSLNSAAVGNDNPMAGEAAFTGTDGGSVGGSWGQSRSTLSGYASAGDAVQLRFEMCLDGCNGVLGWYVDQVSVYECAATASATVDGTVTDALTDWPLYAKVTVIPDDGASQVYYTDPSSGYYSVTVGLGVTHTINIDAVVPGYLPGTLTFNLTDDSTKDFALNVDTLACEAPGYQPGDYLLEESFDSIMTFPAEGWAQVVVTGTNGLWSTDTAANDGDAGEVGPTHSGARLAAFNSWTAGVGEAARLYRTTGLDLSGYSGAGVSFWVMHYQKWNAADRVQLQISTDGGTSWDNVGDAVLRDDGTQGWARYTRDISAYTGPGMTDVRIAFMGISDWGNDLHIDDVLLYQLPMICDAPGGGGLVVGNVYDANSNNEINGVTVSNDSGESVKTADQDIESGFYAIYSPPGDRVFTATLGNYIPATATVAVVLSDTAWQDFTLVAPIMDITPSSLSSAQAPDTRVIQSLTINNPGTADLHWSITGGGTEINVVSDGSFEAGSPNPYWDEGGDKGSPVCDFASCGFDFARTGAWFLWFGGWTETNTSAVTQTVTVPMGTAALRFWLEISGDPSTASGTLEVLMDGTLIASYSEADVPAFSPGYVQAVVDVSAYADGGAHDFSFVGTQIGETVISFWVDDVELIVLDGLSLVSLSPTSGTLAAGNNITVGVTFDSNGVAPGAYPTQLLIDQDTPYDVSDIPVTMEVVFQPVWEKEVRINGELVTFFPVTVVPSDTIEIVDIVSTTTTKNITFNLTEEWTELLGLDDYSVYALPDGTVIVPGFGTTIRAPGKLVVTVADVPGTWEYVITKTFTVLDVCGGTDVITETLVMENTYPPLDSIVLEFVSQSNIYLPLVMRN